MTKGVRRRGVLFTTTDVVTAPAGAPPARVLLTIALPASATFSGTDRTWRFLAIDLVYQVRADDAGPNRLCA